MNYTNNEKFVTDAKENIRIMHVGSLRFLEIGLVSLWISHTLKVDLITLNTRIWRI